MSKLTSPWSKRSVTNMLQLVIPEIWTSTFPCGPKTGYRCTGRSCHQWFQRCLSVKDSPFKLHAGPGIDVTGRSVRECFHKTFQSLQVNPSSHPQQPKIPSLRGLLVYYIGENHVLSRQCRKGCQGLVNYIQNINLSIIVLYKSRRRNISWL